MQQYGLLLSALLPEVPFEEDFSLSLHTTVGVGGAANAFFPQTASQLISIIKLCERWNIKYFPLGAGSNVLAPDGKYNGVVLVTDNFNRIFIEDNFVTAECGVSVGKLLSVCKNRALSGLEFLAGIPARVGGLTFMNAGTNDGHVGDFIDSVTFLKGGKIFTYSKESCCFGYKDSLFQHFPCVILSVRFCLQQSTRIFVEEKIAIAHEKRKFLPKGKSMGCIFKNPAQSPSAGCLIEESGCKGWREGGAKVSEAHANFILNENHASSQDFCRLIQRVKDCVLRHTGVQLQEEIRYMQ